MSVCSHPYTHPLTLLIRERSLAKTQFSTQLGRGGPERHQMEKGATVASGQIKCKQINSEDSDEVESTKSNEQ